MTNRIYLDANSPLKGGATITAIEPGIVPRVRLDQTLFHAKGGGQLGDKGWLNHFAVLETRPAENGEIDHFVSSADGLYVGSSVDIVVDVQSRKLNSRLHSAGHLIANVIESPFPKCKALQAHHYPQEARVEFDASGDLVEPIRAALPQLVADAILADHEVYVEGDPQRSRRIRIGEYSAIPCGGTHVRSLSELINVEITGVKMKSGRLRVSYTVGYE